MADSKILFPSDETIRAAADALAAGELVGVPTETVYGLAADARNQTAVQKIFAAKGRPSNNPLIAHFATPAAAEQWVDINADPRIASQWELAKQFWPGPLTVVAPLKGPVAPAVTAGANTLAVRVPNHPVMRSLLESTEFPLAAPSANRSNYVSPTCARHVAQGFGDSLAMVLDGGDCACGVESTIIRLTKTRPQLLRPGGISIEQLELVFGEIEIATQHKTTSEAMPSPGLLRKHYSPAKRLIKVSEFDAGVAAPDKIARIFFSPDHPDSNVAYRWTRVLSATGNLNEVAQHLFAAIRDADQSDCELIVIDVCTLDGIGRAIMDRVDRASN
ncbi:L-threonylcarbamoyladenylate synthase [Rhodopirellula sp. MGV]|uniref:L-threonylcarbamoyladenylate synthase n=1 Tax=Rhodopirellula sp. MGV TaxID=2023130 RepID=UPI000B965DA9|nr:L-threonylcarbamoyladenylate synthase [Rhodopirellula sp. MGV]OYP36099.1 threonylcarbamoyl-AMP synthase [Rhodopirellula sp. MGV]PNY36542.1 threonylcarbamoyl-AMP synthase [Rhodopirellula baltica]